MSLIRKTMSTLALGVLAAATLAACTADNAPTPTPAPASEATAIPEATAASTSSPSPQPTTRAPFILATPTPPPDLIALAATVWLIDVRDNSLAAIVEDEDTSPYDVDFINDDEVRVRYWLTEGKTDYTFSLDGTPLNKLTPILTCRTTEEGAEIGGRLYPGANCGPISPDGNLMTYSVTTEEQRSWDQWLIELTTGETRLLQPDLLHCGGCDFKFGPAWSPSGLYLIAPDFVHQVFRIDIEANTSVDIAVNDRATQLSEAPVWSPHADRLLRPGPDRSTVLEDFDAGTTRQLDDLPWPAAFDPTGTYIYSPAWWTGASNDTGPVPPARTTIADATTGEVIATRAGAPPWERVWGEPGHPVVAVVAALPNSEDCDGTVVYDVGDSTGACVEGAVAAAFSPDRTLVAFARETGRTGPITGPSDLESYNGLPTWQIAVFDRMTGETTVVAEDAAGGQFPDLTWNEASTHLLIRWPNRFGL